MSKSIDERVVSMQFDNKQFEAGTKQTMSTLEKLKKALKMDGATKGFDDLSNAARKVNFNPISEGLETVKLKFSASYALAERYFNKMMNWVERLGKKFVTGLSFDQISSGWSKYTQKTSSVQTIMNATGKSIDEVNSVLEKLMWFSDETSYAFTDMTSSLAQLASSGANVDKIIPMITGIANATAYAGKGSSEFSRAIYNLNQSYSAGHLQLMDWKSLELAGVASKQLKQELISAAEALGKVKKGEITIENFSSTLSKKWATTEVMEKAFGKFSEFSDAVYNMVQTDDSIDTAADAIEKLTGKYDSVAEAAFKSAQEAKSFQEAIDATKDAVSSGWMTTFEMIFGNYQESKIFWTELTNTLWDVFASGAEARNELLRLGLDNNYQKLSYNLNKSGSSIEQFEAKVANLLTADYVEELVTEFGSLGKAIRAGVIPTVFLEQALDDLADSANNLSLVDTILGRGQGKSGDQVKYVQEALKELGYNLGTFGDQGVDGIFGKYTEEAVKAFQKAKGLTANGIVDSETLHALTEATLKIELFGEEITDLVDDITQKGGRELLFESFQNVVSGITSIVTPIKEAFRDIFPETTSDQLYNFILKIRDFTASLSISEETAEKLKTIFSGVFSVVSSVWKIIKDVLKGIWDGIKTIFPNISELGNVLLSFAADIGTKLSTASEWLKNNFDISETIKNVIVWLKNAAIAIKDWITELYKSEKVQKILQKISGWFSTTFEGMGTTLSNAWEAVKEFFTNFGTEDINLTFSKFGENISAAFKNLANSPFIEKIKGYIQDIKKFFVDLYESIFGKKDGSIKNVIGKSKNKESEKSLEQSVEKELWKPLQLLINGLKRVYEFLKDNAVLIGVVGVVGLTAVAIKKITNFVITFAKDIKTAVMGVSGVYSGITNVMNALASRIRGDGAIDTEESKVKSQVKKTLSTAALIAVLAGALVGVEYAIEKLGTMSPTEIIQGMSAMGLIILAMYVIIKNLGKLDSTSNFSIATLLLSITASLFLMAKAIKEYGEMMETPESIGQMLKGVAAISALFIAFTFLIKKLGSGQSGTNFSAAVELLAIGVVVNLLANVVRKFGEMKLTDLVQGGIAVGLLSGFMAAIVAFLNTIENKNGSSRGTIRSIASIISIAVAMKLLAGSVKKLGELNTTTLIKGTAAVSALIAFMGLAAKWSTTSAASGSKIKSANFVSMSLAILAVAGAIKILENVNIASIVTASAAIVSVIGLIAAVSKASAGAKASLQIAFMAGLVLSIAYAIKTINEINGGEVKNAETTITNILLAIGVIAKSASSLGGNLKTSIAGVASILGIVGIIGGVVYLTVRKLPDIGKSIAKFIVALADPEAMKAIKSLGLGSDSIAGIVGLIRDLASLAKDLAIANILSLGNVGGPMTKFVDALKDLSEPIQELLSNASNVDNGQLEGVDSIMSVVAKLGEIAKAYGPRIEANGKFTKMAGIGFMVEGGISVPMLGQLSTFLSKAAPLLESICSITIGQDINADSVEKLLPIIDILAKIGEVATSTPSIKVAGMGAKMGATIRIIAGAVDIPMLWEFDDFISNAIQPVTNLVTTLNGIELSENFDGDKLGIIISSIAALVSATGDGADIDVFAGAAGGAWGVGGAVGVSVPMIESMSKFIADVAPTVVSMTRDLSGIDNMDNINAEALSAVMTGVKAIAEAAESAPDVTTIAAATVIGPVILGGSYISVPDLEALGSFIAQVGTTCVDIFRDLAGISMPENMESKASVFSSICTNVKILAEVATFAPTKTVAKKASILSESITSDSYVTGADLEGLAKFIVDVATNAGDAFIQLSEKLDTTPIDEKSVTNICKSVRTLASAAAFLPQDAVVDGWFTDEAASTNYAGFIKFINDVGSGVAELARSTNGEEINPKRVQDIAIIIKTLSEAAASLPDNDFALADDEDGPAAMLARFAVSMSNAIQEVSVLTDTIENTSGMVDIASVIKILSDSMYVIDKAIDETSAYFSTGNTGENEITKFVESVVNMLKNLDESIADFDLSNVGDFAVVISNLGQAMLNLYSTDFDSIDVTSLQTKLDEILLMFEHFGSDIQETSKVDSSNSLFTAISDAINSALTSVRTIKYESFKSIGTYLMSGLNTGIVNGFNAVYDSVRAGSSRIVTIAKQIFKIASPSKVFTEIGMYNMMGLAKGTDMYAGLAIDSAKKVSESYIHSITNGPTSIASMITAGFEEEPPVIRPIVDLSNVNRGADAISSMFSNSDLTVRSVNAISGNMAYSKSRIVGNDAIVSAIGDLKDGIIHSDRNTYSINGITYDDGSNIASAIKTLVDAVVVEGRV